MSVFLDIAEDLLSCVSWVGVCSVFDTALDSDGADCFEFVCVGDDVADLGVVSAEDVCEIEGVACDDGFVFCAERHILDDLFDFFVVPDVGGAECVESLFECSIVVVFVVCYVVEPRGSDGVECEPT